MTSHRTWLGTRSFWLALTAVSVSGSSALAADDGGTLSPFAHGAGARAIGMGGAVTASAGDATAMIWNVAGLSRVTRFGVEGGYGELPESGTAEQFASLAIPSWRWGTLGVSIRHVGVNGVEQRDDRNVLVPGALSAGETEMALGYARPVATGVSLGAGLKLQRSAVGTLSDTGYGADLGLTVDAAPFVPETATWLTPLSFGLAVRNALQPSQRLRQDAVVDPRVVRTGVAWARSLTGPATLRLGADLDQSPGVSLHPHVGAELDWSEILALRTGLDGGRWSAGASIRWSTFALDYAYEQRDLSAIHHVGVSTAWGPTTSQSHEQARLAEEHRLAGKLTDIYQHRLAEQVDGLLDRARAASSAGQTQEALDAIAAARALAPDDRRASRLEAEVLRAEGDRLTRAGDPAGAALSYGRALEDAPDDSLAAAGRRRAQLELSRRANRSSHAGELNAAYALLGTGDVVRARNAFRRLHDAMPSDTTTAAMLERIKQALEQRRAAAIQAVRRDVASGRFDDAQRQIDLARSLDTSPADLATLQATVEAGRRQANEHVRPTQEPAAALPVASEAQRREADGRFREGQRLAAGGQTDRAVRAWELALSMDPSQVGARQALQREYLLRGMAAFGHGRLEEADVNWSRAVELDPSDARARGYLEQVRIQIVRTHELTGDGR